MLGDESISLIIIVRLVKNIGTKSMALLVHLDSSFLYYLISITNPHYFCLLLKKRVKREEIKK